MATRMTHPLQDDNGILDYSLGVGTMPWSTVLAEEQANAAEFGDDLTFDYEAAVGWGDWRWVVYLNGHPYLVDGDAPPADPTRSPPAGADRSVSS
jgi:hypothetical protein